MSKINGNSVVKGAYGMFGGDIVFRRVRGKTVMAKPPELRDPGTRTEKQQEHLKRFQKAVKFAN